MLAREEIRHLRAVALANDDVTSAAPFNFEFVVLKERLNALWKVDNADARQDGLRRVRFYDNRLRNPAFVVFNKPHRVVLAKRFGALL